MRQRTLANEIAFQGVGIHTGSLGRVCVAPAPEGFGRRFRVGETEIPARADFVVDTARCTTLGAQGARVSTVEHLLSALAAWDVDNALIVIEGAEIPILDGSALPFFEAIAAAGIEEQSAEAASYRLSEHVLLEERGTIMEASPSDCFSIEVVTEFDNWAEGASRFEFPFTEQTAEAYGREVAPARTFAFDFEVRWLLEQGLAKGGSLENALVITPPNGFSSPLRLPQEWCRHKALDVIGDLALLNARPKFHVRALKPGHRCNVGLAQRLLESRP